eukprot:6176313-Pleurochrysis_carterae.AAC.1
MFFCVFTANACANSLYTLKPTLAAWVPHVACFVAPRQVLRLGDPTRRACDACESFGAMMKKTIKHLTCRRRVDRNTSTAHRRLNNDGSITRWQQVFKRGYIEQSFTRLCVRNSLRHGQDNKNYMQRADALRQKHGKSTYINKKIKSPPIAPRRSIYDLVGAEEE